MNKQDFLNSLRAALGSELSVNLVEDNVRYYEEYINSEIRMGKSEEEVLNMLGNPKLIARSIIEARKNAEGNTTEYTENENRVKVHKMPTWLIVLLVVVVICVVFGALVMFVWWLAPVIVVIWLLVYVVKMFRGKK